MRNRLSSIQNATLNIRGWRSARKIIVFESDDWGGIRTSSLEALDALGKIGVQWSNCHYMSNDRLESESDFEGLFQVLNSVLDKKGNPACFTTNFIVGNPLFDKIRQRDFLNYYYERFTQTYSRYGFTKNLQVINTGIQRKIIFPQLHGREHVNISRWLNDLQGNVRDTMLAFEHEMFGISKAASLSKVHNYGPVFADIKNSVLSLDDFFSESVEIFQDIFKFKPTTFMAPNYVWDDSVEVAAGQNGILFFQGSFKQVIKSSQSEKAKPKINYLGKKSKTGIGYLIRNVSFEPSSDYNKNWVKAALNEINTAFLLGKPAIIDTHRVNYMGGLSKTNQEFGLNILGDLLNAIVRRWPEIEFLNSAELASIIYQRNKK